jgi:hypothetical protein
MADRYLSYSPGRRRVWTEHDVFPLRAIKYWQDGPSWKYGTVFRVYRVSDDGSTITEIPPERWSDE